MVPSGTNTRKAIKSRLYRQELSDCIVDVYARARPDVPDAGTIEVSAKRGIGKYVGIATFAMRTR